VGRQFFHAHWHLIPREKGICEQLRVGVRVVIGGAFRAN